MSEDSRCESHLEPRIYSEWSLDERKSSQEIKMKEKKENASRTQIHKGNKGLRFKNTPLLSDKRKLMLPHHQWLTAATTVITFELNNFFFYSFFYIIFLINKRHKAVIRKELMLIDCLRWLKLWIWNEFKVLYVPIKPRIIGSRVYLRSSLPLCC